MSSILKGKAGQILAIWLPFFNANLAPNNRVPLPRLLRLPVRHHATLYAASLDHVIRRPALEHNVNAV